MANRAVRILTSLTQSAQDVDKPSIKPKTIYMLTVTIDSSNTFDTETGIFKKP